MIKVHGGSYLNSINTLELERKKLLSLKMRYESAKLEFEKALPQKFVINKADVPEIPSKPRRILTSFIVGVSTFILSIILIFILNSFSGLRKQYLERYS